MRIALTAIYSILKSRYKDRHDFKNKNPKLYKKLLLNCPHDLNRLFRKMPKWNLQTALDVAKQYKNRTEFCRSKGSAYYYLLNKFPKELNKVLPKRW